MKKEVSLASLKDDVQEAIAYIDDCGCCEENVSVDVLRNTVEYLNQRLRYVGDSISELWTALYEHTSNGHLPKLVGAAQMEKALKVLGLDGDYDVQKRVIYASDSGEPVEAWVQLLPKKK